MFCNSRKSSFLQLSRILIIITNKYFIHQTKIKKEKKMKNLIYVVLLVFIVGIAGCGKKDTDVTVKTSGDNKTDVKTKDVDVSTGKLPDDFPSDIPQYKDAKILASAKTAMGTTVTFEINDKAKAVADFYKTEMKKSNYDADKNNDMMATDKGGVLVFKKGGKDYTFTYGYNDATSKTSLVILIK
jgi:hypothetical protein